MPITSLPTMAEFEGPKVLKPGVAGVEYDERTYAMRVGAQNALLQRVIDLYQAVGEDDGSTPGSLRAAVLGTAVHPVELIVGNALEGWTTSECNYLDAGNGAQLRQAGLDALALAPLRVRIVVAPGTYTLPLPANQFYCPGNAEIVAGVMPSDEHGARSVTIVGVPPTAATFAALDGRMAHVDAHGVVRGIRFEQHGSTVTSATGSAPESQWQIVSTGNPVTFDACEFFFRQEPGTYLPVAPIGGYQNTTTINGIVFRRCLFDVELEGNTWLGLRDIEILRYRKIDAFWTGSPPLLTSILEDCVFRYEPNVVVTGDGVTGKALIYADGGCSMRRVYIHGSLVLDNRGSTLTAGAKFAGMFAEDVTFDFRETGWHAQLSLIAGASDHDCEWLAPYIRGIRILKGARDLTGWLEIVAFYGPGPSFVGTTIESPTIEDVHIVGDGDVVRFQTVISSTAPGHLRHVVVRGHHAPDPECQVYVNNHWTPPHSVPDRVQHIDGITLDDVHVGLVKIGQNIAGTSAEISRVSISGGSQIGVFETETDMVITDVVDVSADSSVGSWIMDTPFPVGHAARRFVFGSAPTAADDSARGYRVGDRADVTGGGVYRCTSAAAAAATWSRVDPGGLPAIAAGNFTASFYDFVNVASVAHGANPNCKFMRIDRMVRVEMQVRVTPSAAAIMNFAIGDLPFAPKVEATEKYIGFISPAYYAPVPDGGVWMFGSGSNMVRMVIGSTGGTSPVDMIITFTYEAAS